MSTPLRILVVEDDPIIAADLVERIVDLGYARPEHFDNGEDALKAMLADPPDLTLMDVQLSGNLDGIQTVACFRESAPNAAVVFLTSNTDEGTFVRARTLRPRAFLGKPFRSRDLRHTIELAVGTPPPPAPATPPASHGGDEVYRLKDRIFVKHKDRLQRILIADIRYARADDYYCKVATADREYLVTKTLKKFAEHLLASEGFFRTHRSYVVNLHHVEAIDHGHVLVGGERIPVSKGAREDLMKALMNV